MALNSSHGWSDSLSARAPNETEDAYEQRVAEFNANLREREEKAAMIRKMVRDRDWKRRNAQI